MTKVKIWKRPYYPGVLHIKIDQKHFETYGLSLKLPPAITTFQFGDFGAFWACGGHWEKNAAGEYSWQLAIVSLVLAQLVHCLRFWHSYECVYAGGVPNFSPGAPKKDQNGPKMAKIWLGALWWSQTVGMAWNKLQDIMAEVLAQLGVCLCGGCP